MDNLWTRRTNSGKLSLSTAGTSGDSSSSGRNNTTTNNNNASFSKRFGGDTSSHGSKTANPFNAATTPGGGLISPTGGASSAFGLGSGAFASFGSAKTPKTPGNPFDLAMAGGGAASTAKTPGTEKSAREGGLNKTVGKPASMASLADSKTAAATSSTVPAERSVAAHSLRSSWVFWFRPPISKANGYIEYEKTLHPIAGCDTAEHFFTIYKHLKRPSALPVVSDYHLFKKGVRPIWEDDENRKGGKWIVRLKKGVADRYWEDLLLAMIGDQFGDAGEEVCGAVLSVRNGEDILSIWTRTDGGRVLKIRETMKRVLAFPPDTKVEWKSHDSSIQQRTAIEESRREKGGTNHQHERRGNKPQQQQSHDDNQKQGSTAT